jgi:hypothetical protein
LAIRSRGVHFRLEGSSLMREVVRKCVMRKGNAWREKEMRDEAAGERAKDQEPKQEQ